MGHGRFLKKSSLRSHFYKNQIFNSVFGINQFGNYPSHPILKSPNVRLTQSLSHPMARSPNVKVTQFHIDLYMFWYKGSGNEREILMLMLDKSTYFKKAA